MNRLSLDPLVNFSFSKYRWAYFCALDGTSGILFSFEFIEFVLNKGTGNFDMVKQLDKINERMPTRKPNWTKTY